MFPHRIGRLDYFIRSTIFWLTSIFLSALIKNAENWILILILFVLIVLLVFLQFRVYVIPRIRDIGWSPNIAWLFLVPGVNVIFGIMLWATPGK